MIKLDKPWFGKKRVGYGPAPKTWQGWLLTIALLVIVITDVMLFRHSILSIIIFILAVVVFLVIAYLTSAKPEIELSEEEYN